MHFALLGIGILLGLYGLYKFFLVANLRQITAFFLVSGFVVSCLAIFFLAISGRLPLAFGAIIALLPLLVPILKKNRQTTEETPPTSSNNQPMTRAEALEVLGLKDPVTDADIKTAYTKLVKKVHPDQEGSSWMTSKLNQARDLLLKK